MKFCTKVDCRSPPPRKPTAALEQEKAKEAMQTLSTPQTSGETNKWDKLKTDELPMLGGVDDEEFLALMDQKKVKETNKWDKLKTDELPMLGSSVDDEEFVALMDQKKVKA